VTADRARPLLAMLFSAIAHAGVLVLPADEFGMGGSGGRYSLEVRVTTPSSSAAPAPEDQEAATEVASREDAAAIYRLSANQGADTVESGDEPEGASANAPASSGKPTDMPEQPKSEETASAHEKLVLADDRELEAEQQTKAGESESRSIQETMAALDKLPPSDHAEPQAEGTAATAKGESGSETNALLPEPQEQSAKFSEARENNVEPDAISREQDLEQGELTGSEAEAVMSQPSKSGQRNKRSASASAEADRVDKKIGSDTRSAVPEPPSSPPATAASTSSRPPDIPDEVTPATDENPARQATAEQPKQPSIEAVADTSSGREKQAGTESAGDAKGLDGEDRRTPDPVAEPDVRAQPAYGATPRPDYPERARELGQEGTVILLVLVDKDGSVAEAEVDKSSGYSLLDGSALATVKRKWQFKPGTVNGNPVASRVRVPISFRISR